MPEPFRLTSTAKHRPARFDNQPATRQSLLLVDMDDLAGQLSMFQLNGQDIGCRVCGSPISGSDRFNCQSCAESEQHELADLERINK